MFTMSILTDNAAFDDEPATEIARILQVVATRMLAGYTEGACMDINGNRVGEYGVQENRRRRVSR